jgi:hypothetical protein
MHLLLKGYGYDDKNLTQKNRKRETKTKAFFLFGYYKQIPVLQRLFGQWEFLNETVPIIVYAETLWTILTIITGHGSRYNGNIQDITSNLHELERARMYLLQGNSHFETSCAIFELLDSCFCSVTVY